MSYKNLFKSSKHIQLYTILSMLLALPNIVLADEPIVTKGTRWSDTLIEFSVSGDKANDGKDGQSFRGQTASDGFFSGADGSNGRDGLNGAEVLEAPKGRVGRILLESSSAGMITFSGSFVGSP